MSEEDYFYELKPENQDDKIDLDIFDFGIGGNITKFNSDKPMHYLNLFENTEKKELEKDIINKILLFNDRLNRNYSEIFQDEEIFDKNSNEFEKEKSEKSFSKYKNNLPNSKQEKNDFYQCGDIINTKNNSEN